MSATRRAVVKRRPLAVRIAVRRVRKHKGRISSWVVLCETCGQVIGVDHEGKEKQRLARREAFDLAVTHSKSDHDGRAEVTISS